MFAFISIIKSIATKFLTVKVNWFLN